MALVEKLIAAIDPVAQVAVYTFARGEEFDQSLAFTAVSTPVQGRHYGYDALGLGNAPVAPRTIVWKFNHPLAPGESYTDVRNALITVIGQGRRILLEKQFPNGTLVLCDARCVNIPDKATVENAVWCEYTLTFQMLGDWYGKDITSARWDSGLHWDTGGLRWDQNGIYTPVIGAATPVTLTNNGTVVEWAGIFTFTGPLAAPWTFTNFSVDVRGVPLIAGTGQPLALTCSASIPAGSKITIDSGGNTVTSDVAGIVPWAVFTKAPGQKYYVGLGSGANVCSLGQAGSATGGGVLAFTRDRWR